MEIIDISVPISPSMVVWPGALKTEFSWRRSMDRGDKNNNSNLAMSCHSGTHVDAPLHFVKGGQSVENIPLDLLVGKVFVLDLSQSREITLADLEKFWPQEKVDRVLFKTPNSKIWKTGPETFVEEFCALREKETRWLLKKGIRLVGIDYLSIQHFGDSPIVHQLLLTAGVVIIEGLDLSPVSSGFYELICLPLKLVGLEGAPARVALRK